MRLKPRRGSWILVLLFVIAWVSPMTARVQATHTAGYSIGDTGPGGGIIFYDAGSQQSWGQYLESAPANWDGTNNNEDPYVQWGCRGMSIQTATAIGTGAANTFAIITGCSGTTAASTARAYRGGGKSDWFLPSRDELEQMEVRRSVLGFGGNTWHWSSTQYSAQEANSRWLGTASNGLYFYWKDFGDQVRPIRAIQGVATVTLIGYPADQNWEAVTYGANKFVSVASSGNGNRVMTSTDGNYWVSRTSASNSNWQGITYADNQFVAVGSNAVMTSPNGIDWTLRTAPTGEWQAITNCGGLFVATATWGSNYVMTSTNGADWTIRTPAYAWSHDAVACSATVPRFVSVSQYGRGWSSADGISGWSIQNPGAIVDIRTVAFGNGRFSWLEYSGNAGTRYGGYSTNGVNWSAGLTPANQWKYITYGGNKFIAVAEGGVNSRSAYSTDGANWTVGSGVPNNSWQGVTYGAGKYVAVANSGTGNRVITSADGQSWQSVAITAPYFNSVENFSATANEDGSVTLDWDAPATSNTAIYGYSINFVDYDNGVERGGWGIWTLAANTSYSLNDYMFNGSNPITTGYGDVRFKVYAMSAACAGVGNGSCLYGPSTNADAIVIDATPPTTTTTTSTTTTTLVPTTTTSTTTTTTSTTTTIVPEPETTTTTEPESVTTTTEPEPETTTTTVSPTTTNIIETIFEPVDTTDPVVTPEVDPTPATVPEEEAPVDTIPEVVIPENTQDAADNAVADIFQNTDNADELGAAVADAIANADSPEEVAALVTSLLDGPLSTEEFAAVVDAVFADDLSTEELSAALDAVFAEPLSDEKFAEVISAVLDSPLTDEQFAEVIGVLESDTVTEDQVAAAVDNILENGVTADQATELATSDKVLASIDGDQAAEIFAEIPVGELTQEEEAALVEAVTNAPEEVKNAFEETINVYGEGLDDYVPVGSSVDVGSRRTLLAASAALTAATAGMAGSGPSGGSGGSGGGSGGSGGGRGDNNNNTGRKEDEDPDGEEEDTEIEGPEDQEDNNFTRNSIFKYEEETMKRRFSPWGFIKKFSRETSALAFTISGSIVVFATLSGETRKITVIATGCAFLVHYLHAMIKNDED